MCRCMGQTTAVHLLRPLVTRPLPRPPLLYKMFKTGMTLRAPVDVEIMEDLPDEQCDIQHPMQAQRAMQATP